MRNDKHLSEETLNAYLDGELDADENSQVKAHLDTCTACQAELEALQELFSTLDELGMSPVPAPDLMPSVLARVRPRRRAIKLRWVIPTLQGVAALALLAWGWTQLIDYWTAAVDALPIKPVAETWSQVAEWTVTQWATLNTWPNAAWSNVQAWITSLTPSASLGLSLPQLAMTSVILTTLWLACNMMLVRRSLLNGHKTQS